MIKLSRYLKKYSAFMLLAVVLLFGQAILDLNLPNKMSDIVNVGIQKNGIEEIAPKALPTDAFALMTLFMNEEDVQAADSAYTLYSKLTPEQQAQTDKIFPDAGKLNAMVLTGEGDELKVADGAMGRAGYAFMQFAQAAAEKTGQNIGSVEGSNANFDLATVQKNDAHDYQRTPAGF